MPLLRRGKKLLRSPVRRLLRDFRGLVVFGEQLLSSSKPTPQAILKLRVSLSLLNMGGNRSPNHLRYGLLVDTCHRLELFSLLCGKTDRHRLWYFHD